MGRGKNDQQRLGKNSPQSAFSKFQVFLIFCEKKKQVRGFLRIPQITSVFVTALNAFPPTNG
jgi:hypothetical protein